MPAAPVPTGDARRYGHAVRAAAEVLRGASDSPQLDAQLLLAASADVPRSKVLAFPEREIGEEAFRRFTALVERRARGEPLAYLIGERDFLSLTVAVSPAVLVPRPETEHLVEEALARLAADEAVDVLDLGTGSGAIALAVKHARPLARVVGADASDAALAVARDNALRLGLDVRWVRSEWFAALDGATFDAILCNPPYLRSRDPHFERGLEFEPRAALDGGPDGLDAIRAVLRGAPVHLKPGGWLLLEHGYDQQREVVALAEQAGFEAVETGRDLGGRDRYVIGRRPA